MSSIRALKKRRKMRRLCPCNTLRTTNKDETKIRPARPDFLSGRAGCVVQGGTVWEGSFCQTQVSLVLMRLTYTFAVGYDKIGFSFLQWSKSVCSAIIEFLAGLCVAFCFSTSPQRNEHEKPL
ncbi:hypothetical protein L596_026554 [Steinernema carpocapsae]|uniref:Uncharacterized protein n=1 Tax=Steinernema carpocapsae TaxID=34508 RepID=A0A4U5M1P9_STECR|nr:hypothetical protein L596_026554 [Steinernema carpocapsae]